MPGAAGAAGTEEVLQGWRWECRAGLHEQIGGKGGPVKRVVEWVRGGCAGSRRAKGSSHTRTLLSGPCCFLRTARAKE